MSDMGFYNAMLAEARRTAWEMAIQEHFGQFIDHKDQEEGKPVRMKKLIPYAGAER